MAQYQYGQTVTFTATFKVSGVETNPSTITFWTQAPDGTETSYTYAGGGVTRVSTGVYSKAIRLGAAGTWYYRWIGTGTAAQEFEGNVTVGPQTQFSTV